MSADHVYDFDFRDALDTHRRRGAECTVVTTTCSLEEASQHATVTSRRDGTVREFRYKPDRATTRTIATEIFIYDPQVLIEGLELLARETTVARPPTTPVSATSANICCRGSSTAERPSPMRCRGTGSTPVVRRPTCRRTGT